jgi:hypothetical protein
MKEEVILSHEDFIIGITNRTVRLEILQPTKENRGIGFFEKGSFSGITNNILTLLTWFPLIVIPIICYKQSNWLLLCGFLGVFFGMALTGIELKTSNPRKEFLKSIFSFALLPAVLVYYLGIFNILAFVSICFYYEHFFSMVNNLVYEEMVKQNLLRNSDSYYGAQIGGRIKTYLISR